MLGICYPFIDWWTNDSLFRASQLQQFHKRETNSIRLQTVVPLFWFGISFSCNSIRWDSVRRIHRKSGNSFVLLREHFYVILFGDSPLWRHSLKTSSEPSQHKKLPDIGEKKTNNQDSSISNEMRIQQTLVD